MEILQHQLERGLSVRLTGVAPGERRVTAKRSGKAVGSCVAHVARDGAGRCTLRFSKRARRAMKKAERVTLKFAGASAASKVTLTR